MQKYQFCRRGRNGNICILERDLLSSQELNSVKYKANLKITKLLFDVVLEILMIAERNPAHVL